MKSEPLKLTYRIELQSGKKLTLPASLVENVGSGDWLITIEQVSPKTSSGNLRSHDAFLNSYAPEDEGLYNAKCD
ncbi:MAG: hypothetical protein BRC51_05130 [Cyanobacteria bacterium SW_12_48_29]|nr:MAG: hypothetical protein BRC42_14605 [Cyanobacteria bacterium QS_1_48_34]PSO78122.1 MAG: hypothetical protein BRC44_11740 [Cyanobacteria bacterium QS_4_48_99]PSO83070.1 MAG: hypothetical protein BRC45_08485 [Cyanobacteria bacterium QS_5_48_63]PSP02675.1 MAG: hypothetical protein BRC54_13935 [Cyanobacteria bacterium SW_7_48_12]PSP05542.1 MAG: hypothetical protein BRC51_05130 [Cyanobacteria bacterium SW_12_48_29]PSP12200.1 MAG: hypothetical protein BRC49_05775 [Cyanobacteria bacterium SW_10_